jgi:hypothetical protein
MSKPFLHCHHRFKNGKDHCYWSISEKVATRQGWVQRHLLYLGEINDSQRAAWTRLTEVFDPSGQASAQLALFRRDTQPEKDHKMLLAQLGWGLPPQAPPRITARGRLLED